MFYGNFADVVRVEKGVRTTILCFRFLIGLGKGLDQHRSTTHSTIRCISGLLVNGLAKLMYTIPVCALALHLSCHRK